MPDAPPPPPAEAPHPEPHGVPDGRVMHVVYVCALAASVVGLYFGVRYRPAPPPTLHAATPAVWPAPPSGALPARAYGDITPGSLGPNAHWPAGLTAPAAPTEPYPPAPTPATDADREAARAGRAARRAFAGAPPTIPHRIDSVSAASCVACHTSQGLRVGEVIAPPMPHAAYASCTQCHAPQTPVAPDEAAWLNNHFVGLNEPLRGQRAWEGAPPTIPHPTAMRSNCMACHGPNGAQAMRSTHPWRASCTQCHAPSAQLDRQPGGTEQGRFFLPPPVPQGE